MNAGLSDGQANKSGLSDQPESFIQISQEQTYDISTPRYVGKSEKTRDFSGDDEWLRENSEEYQGKYVATHGNRLIASGNGFKEVATKAREEGFPDALLRYIELLDTPPYIGGVW